MKYEIVESAPSRKYSNTFSMSVPTAARAELSIKTHTTFLPSTSYSFTRGRRTVPAERAFALACQLIRRIESPGWYSRSSLKIFERIPREMMEFSGYGFLAFVFISLSRLMRCCCGRTFIVNGVPTGMVIFPNSPHILAISIRGCGMEYSPRFRYFSVMLLCTDDIR